MKLRCGRRELLADISVFTCVAFNLSRCKALMQSSSAHTTVGGFAGVAIAKGWRWPQESKLGLRAGKQGLCLE